jgi:hypothetical protein
MSVTGKIDLGFPTDVFNRTAAGSGNSFSLPNESGRYHGAMILQAIGRIGAAPGTITALVVDLEVSLDGGTTWNKLVTGITLSTLAISVNVAGLGTGATLRLTSTTFTLNTATSIVVYANAG